MADDNVEYVGRADHQVKIRGFRIELGEIEARIGDIAGVVDVAVVARRGASGSYLVAYIVMAAELERPGLAKDIEARLAQVLPEYMVPAQIVLLASLPRLISGKLDREALPEPVAAEVAREYKGPRTEVERRLVEIWQDVLGAERVGISDNFFELGGDSILSLQVISRVRNAELGFSLRLRDLIRHQTIEALVENLAAQPLPAPPREFYAADGEAPLLPIQAWFFQEDIPSRNHFNQSVMLRATGHLNPDSIRARGGPTSGPP
ncbi:MAG: phosphopantetheine-binding protein [Polyangiaceae bacterium]